MRDTEPPATRTVGFQPPAVGDEGIAAPAETIRSGWLTRGPRAAELRPPVAGPVVEDAAHAVATAYRGRKIGGLSDATCFSLYATKNVAAGEGGLIATNRDDLAAAVADLRVTRRGDGRRYDVPVPGYKAN